MAKLIPLHSPWRSSLANDHWAISSIYTCCCRSYSSLRYTSYLWFISRTCQRRMKSEFLDLRQPDHKFWFSILRRGPIDLEAKFEPNLLNTAIYLIGLSQQVSTFAINFQVRGRSNHLDSRLICSFRVVLSVKVSGRIPLSTMGYSAQARSHSPVLLTLYPSQFNGKLLGW